MALPLALYVQEIKPDRDDPFLHAEPVLHALEDGVVGVYRLVEKITVERKLTVTKRSNPNRRKR